MEILRGLLVVVEGLVGILVIGIVLLQKARDQGIQSIAEFVQDAASMSILFSQGIDYVEGNFLAIAGPDMNYEFDA